MRIQQYLYRKQLRQSETPSRPKAVSNTILACRRDVVERPLRRTPDNPADRGKTDGQ